MLDKDLYLKSLLSEAMDELTSDYETFSDYKRGMSGGGNFFVYSQVDKSSIPNICLNGADGSKEYFQTMIYGRGIYSVLSFKECASYYHKNAMVKYAVKKGAFDNFLIFDIGIRKDLYASGALTLHEKISSTIKRLFSPEDFAMLEHHYGQGLRKLDDAVMQADHSHKSEWLEEEFLRVARSGEGSIQLRPGVNYNSEKRLDESNVDGWIYQSGYGRTAIFRTTDLLIPYQYVLGIGRWAGGESDQDWKYCINDEETFDNINVSTDAFRRARKNYPDTRFTEKTVAGFSLVKRGKKYNLLSARTGKTLSPVDFDECEAFNPMTNTAAFAIKDDDGAVYEFMVHSEGRGKNLTLQYRERDNEEESQWEELSYEDFVDVMNELKGNLNESVDEVFTHADYNSFKQRKASGKDVILYSSTDPKTAKLIYDGGCNSEFSGTGLDPTLYYGLGVYTVRNTQSLKFGKYGGGAVKYILKDGYKDFLILDDPTRRKYDPGQSVYDEIVRLCPKDIIERLDRFFKKNLQGYSLNNYTIKNDLMNKGVDSFKNISLARQTGKTGESEFNTASFARAIKLCLQGQNLHDPLAPHLYDELLMARTRIRGIVFNGGEDGNVVFVRDFNALMPIAYSVDRARTWLGEDDDDEDRFNRINRKVDPFYSYRGEYETTHHRAKPICGFSLVSGKQGYNYKDIWYHRPLLPVDAEFATPFDPMTNEAHFTLLGVDFTVHTDDDYNIKLTYVDEGEVVECPFEDFSEFLDIAREQGALNGKKTYPNSLLDPNNDRKK